LSSSPSSSADWNGTGVPLIPVWASIKVASGFMITSTSFSGTSRNNVPDMPMRMLGAGAGALAGSSAATPGKKAPKPARMRAVNEQLKMFRPVISVSPGESVGDGSGVQEMEGQDSCDLA